MSTLKKSCRKGSIQKDCLTSMAMRTSAQSAFEILLVDEYRSKGVPQDNTVFQKHLFSKG